LSQRLPGLPTRGLSRLYARRKTSSRDFAADYTSLLHPMYAKKNVAIET
jgi:hypothetical protein